MFIHALKQVAPFTNQVVLSQRTLIFLDPSSHATAPGWPLRNVLSYLSLAHSITSLRLIALRDGVAQSTNVKLSGDALQQGKPSVVGWEKNDKGKLGPRMADLAPLMDPTKCVEAFDFSLSVRAGP